MRIKKILTALLLVMSSIAISQTNTFPTSGNVGIGTLSPQAKLQIMGSAGYNNYNPQEDLLHIGGNELGGNGGYAGLRLGGTSNGMYYTSIRSVKTGAYGQYWNNALTFNVTNTNTFSTLSEVMRLTSDAFVGIGTTTPSQKMHVVGNAMISAFNPGENGSYLTGTDARLTILDGNIYDDTYGGITFGGMYVENNIRRQATYNHIGFGAGALRISNNQQTKLLIGAGDEWGNQNVVINPTGGNVGIGTTNPGTYKLAVEGTIGARKLKVTQGSWADDVFKANYKLMPITELENFIQKNNHLPGVPSEKEVKGKDLDISETQTMLLKKIEELTLYVIELKKENKKQDILIKELKRRK